MNTAAGGDASRALPALDPRSLGRPIHLLDGFAEHFRDDLGALLQTRLNRRYRASFEVGAVAMQRAFEAAPAPGSWLMHGSAAGRLAFAIDRSLLLCVLDYRYGTGAAGGDHPPARRTTTEERLAAMLGRVFVAALAERVGALPGASGEGPQPTCEPCAAPPGVPVADWWTLRAEIAEPSRGVRGAMWFALDDAWMSRLLRGLAPLRERRSAGRRAREPLPRRLRLTLFARLLDKEFPLGTVMDLRVGDVIPIRLGAADVLVGDSVLLRASVAEHRGKLCLTSFEDLE